MTPRIAALLLALAALPANAAPRTLTQYLSGTDSSHAVPWEFFCEEGKGSGKWTTIPVPSCWEMQGFGRLHYGKEEARYGPVRARYRHDFRIPTDWAGRRILLVFDGVMTDADVTVNGKSAGPTHQGAFYRFEYDVTDLVKPGARNRLEMTVTDKSANASVTRAEREADFWVFGGVFRPVWLKAVPRQFIDRVAIDARADGVFAMDVFLGGAGGADVLETEIVDAAGNPAGAPVRTPVAAPHVTTRVAWPAPWTAETPNLYTAVVRLRKGGRVVHEIRQRFGFRTIEVRPGDGFYVNGKRVLLKGVNRHSFWPTTGRTLDEKVHRGDIALMKAMNMNAVRMCHYPPDERFLDLCDEKGLYVLDELTGWQHFYDTDVGRKLGREMLARDVNHPSIVLWANGNEGGFNFELDALFGEMDPQRRPVVHPWAKFGPMDTKHYPTWKKLTEILAGGDVILPTEFLHGLYDGGHGAGLEDFWNAIRTSKTGAGGFLWALVDEGVQVPGEHRIDVKGNMAPDGIVGPYRQKEGSFDTIREIWAPVQFPRALPADFTGTLEVENRYDFTNLAACGFRWQLRKLGRKPGFTVEREGRARAPEVAPGARGELRLDGYPGLAGAADALAVTALDPAGRELRTWVWPLRRPDDVAVWVGAGHPVEPVRAGDELEFRAGATRLRVGATDGRLIELRVEGEVFPLTSGPIAGARWSLDASGWIRLDYEVPAGLPPAREIGVSFNLPESRMRKKTWLGDGPFRVWRNRRLGPTFGVWETAANDTVTGGRGWVYPEFAGYFADVRWMRIATKTRSLRLVIPESGAFVRVGTPAQAEPKWRAHTAIDFPPGTLAVLRDIPPMGTKFHPAAEMGPQCTEPTVTGAYRGTIHLRVE